MQSSPSSSASLQRALEALEHLSRATQPERVHAAAATALAALAEAGNAASASLLARLASEVRELQAAAYRLQRLDRRQLCHCDRQQRRRELQRREQDALAGALHGALGCARSLQCSRACVCGEGSGASFLFSVQRLSLQLRRLKEGRA